MPVSYDQRTLPLSRGSIPAAAGVTLAWDFTGFDTTVPEAQPFLYGGATAPTMSVTGTRTAVTYNGIPGIRLGNPASYSNTTFLGQGLQVGTGDFQVAVLITTGATLPTSANSVNAFVVRNDAGTALVSFVVAESNGNGWYINAASSTGEGAAQTAVVYGANKTIVMWFRRRAGVTNVWTQEATPTGILIARNAAGSDSTDWNDTSAKRVYLGWNQSSAATIDVAFHGVRFWGGTSLDDATTQNVGRDFFALEANVVPSDGLTITSPTAGSSIPTTTTISGTYTGTAPAGVQVQHGGGTWVTLSGFSASAGVWSGNAVLPVAVAAVLRARYSNNTVVVSADVANITVEANSISFTVPMSGGSPDPAGARNYRLFQRNGSNQATGVRITGEYDGAPTAIQWRFNGGSWATLVASPSGGAFDATVTLSGPAQGALEIRFANDTAVSASLTLVGVGDVYIAAGQSNAAGWSPSFLQPVPPSANPTWKAVEFDFAHTWRENFETPDNPFHDPAVAVYSAFGSGGGRNGTYYGHLATLAMAAGVPIAVVPAARGSSTIDMWEANNPTDTNTLYGALQATAQRIGSCRAVLWWQGEGSMSDDATGTGLDPSLYAGKLDAIMDAFAASGQTAEWVLTMPCHANPTPKANGALFRAALAGMASNEHVLGVLDLDSPTPAYDTLHYEGSAEIVTIASRMASLLGYSVAMTGPVVTPGAGTITATGGAPSVITPIVIPPQPITVSPVGAWLTLSGNQPNIVQGVPPVPPPEPEHVPNSVPPMSVAYMVQDKWVYEKDPEAVATYQVNWASWLAGRTPTSIAWTSPGLTVVATSFLAGMAAISLSGGTHLSTYTVTCQVLTETDSESFSFQVRVIRNAQQQNTMAVLVEQARGVLSDRREPYRYSGDDLLGYANDALAVLATVRPELFTALIKHKCEEGVVQRLPLASTIRISSIAGLRPTTRELVERFDPDWMTAELSTPAHWIPYEGDPRRFYVTPPAQFGHPLDVSAAYAPERYAMQDEFPVLRVFWPAVMDYVVGMAEARDDEHVLRERAQQFISKAASLMGSSNG
ncbi:MAG: hypothetical protein KGZ68_04700 [Dechloromonas sp.]|nr:hypothetical protein [Dechloromonas sp.]